MTFWSVRVRLFLETFTDKIGNFFGIALSGFAFFGSLFESADASF